MVMRLAALGDIHGNLAALESALTDIKRHKPDRVLVAGDLVFFGSRPAEVVDRLRKLESEGAQIIQGNTDVAVADFDYAAAFPRFDDVPASLRAATEWAHDQLSDDQLEWLRHLPSERRVWADGLLVLSCHGSPGSQTAGLGTDLDPTVTMERATRTDARVIVCGHTHVADVRELGRKLICNPGSCGVAFDGDPAACWALLTIPDQSAATDGTATDDEYD
ncbi:MAG: metallophosphoesterase family protein, partial [Candidatus Limnocylindrales bacterium]